MKAERMMKWRVRRQSKCSSSNSEVNEDVRRSLEILDNVLAEFEDHDIFTSPSDILLNGDDEQGTHPFDAHQGKERWEDENGNKLEQSKLPSSYHCSSNGDLSSEFHSLDSSIDGSTSQYPFYLDESRRCSAPPVPKRSPGTRLSNRDRTFLHKEDDEDESSYIHRSHHSLGSLQLTSSQNGDLSSAEGKRKVALSVPTPPGTSSSSSPVDDNGQISNRLRHKQIKNQQCLEFYLVRNGDDEDAADDDVFLSPPRRDVKCKKTTTCRVCGSNLDRNTSTPSPTDYRFSMDATKSSEYNLRYVMLEKKFAKVKVLLKTNQITGLDKPPPSFKPPPPPISHKKPTIVKQGGLISNTNVVSSSATWGGARKGHHDSEHLQRPRVSSLSETRTTTNGGLRFRMTKSDTRDSPTDKERFSVPKTFDGQFPKNASSCTKCESKDLDRIASDHSDELKQAIKESKERRNNENVSANISPADVLCQNCINKGWTFKSSEFVPQSPSPLKRPPLGLSYSMEDDLSPGIKEIVSPVPNMVDGQSDSVMSSPKSSPVAHMSTFSHSASSLGDGSSQSDLDFSTSVDSGKVPLTSIKSLTLPTDMKLGPSPFYSDTEGEHINGTETKLGVKSSLEAVRSSSAPPPPQDKGNWKKDKTRFIRKEEQDENDAVDSSHQDEGEATTDEKPKKRSVWKSILRRK